MRLVLRNLSAKVLCVTLGHEGSRLVASKGGLVHCPAFDLPVVDTMGAGDAFLAVTSLLVYKGLDTETVGLLGNAYAILKVNTLGNVPVSLSRYRDFVEDVL